MRTFLILIISAIACHGAAVIRLDWKAPASNNAESYRVYQSLGTAPFEPVTNTQALSVTLPLDTNALTRFRITGLNPAAATAQNPDGEGPPSNVWTNMPGSLPVSEIYLSAIALNQTNVVRGQTISGTAWFINRTANPILIIEGTLTARQPGALNASGPFDDWTPSIENATVQPGQMLPVPAAWIVRSNAPLGTWQCYLAIKTEAGWIDGPNTPFTVSALTPPSAPQNLTGNVISASRIDLNWHDTSDTETGFALERSEDGIRFSRVRTAPANSEAAIDSGLRRNKRYWYRLASRNSAGQSDYSNTATAKTFKH